MRTYLVKQSTLNEIVKSLQIKNGYEETQKITIQNIPKEIRKNRELQYNFSFNWPEEDRENKGHLLLKNNEIQIWFDNFYFPQNFSRDNASLQNYNYQKTFITDVTWDWENVDKMDVQKEILNSQLSKIGYVSPIIEILTYTGGDIETLTAKFSFVYDSEKEQYQIRVTFLFKGYAKENNNLRKLQSIDFTKNLAWK